MSVNSLIIIYLVMSAFDIHLFFKQRAALEIGRQMGQEIRHLVLSSSFHTIANVMTVAKLAVLGYMCYLGSWMMAAGLGLGVLLLTSILPIPNGYYKDVYNKIGRF